MSENAEELDLEKISVWEFEDLKKAIKQSLNDYDGEICSMDGKTLKIRDFINLDFLTSAVKGEIQCNYLRELTCSLKKNLQPVKTRTK
jgi:hypothetical protein